MASRKTKEAKIALRLQAKDREALEKEAAAEGLDFSAYVRQLLLTHPKRQKKPG